MPRKSQKALLEEFEVLLDGLREATHRPIRAVSLQDILSSALDEAREIREGREIFLAAAQEARQNLARAVRRGHDAAMTVRNYLKAYYGPYNDELTRFGINPIRRGASKRARPAAAAGRVRRMVPLFARTPHRPGWREGDDVLRDIDILQRTVNDLRGCGLMEADEWMIRKIAENHARHNSRTS